MPTTVACPKCSTKYKLPDSMLGKAVQCQKCKTRFKVAANQKAPAGAPGSKPARQNTAQSKELQKFGLDGPIDAGGNDIFDSPAPAGGGADLLGNHALDPGFSAPSQAGEKSEADDDTDTGVLFENPAIVKKKKKKKFELPLEARKTKLENFDPDPFDFKTAIKEVWFVLLITLGPIAVAGVLFPYFGGLQFDIVSTVTRILCAVVGGFVGIWGLVQAYRTSESVVTLLLCLFVPFYFFYYSIKKWDLMKPVVLAILVTILVQVIYIPFDFMGDDF